MPVTFYSNVLKEMESDYWVLSLTSIKDMPSLRLAPYGLGSKSAFIWIIRNLILKERALLLLGPLFIKKNLIEFVLNLNDEFVYPPRPLAYYAKAVKREKKFEISKEFLENLKERFNHYKWFSEKERNRLIEYYLVRVGYFYPTLIKSMSKASLFC